MIDILSVCLSALPALCWSGRSNFDLLTGRDFCGSFFWQEGEEKSVIFQVFYSLFLRINLFSEKKSLSFLSLSLFLLTDYPSKTTVPSRLKLIGPLHSPVVYIGERASPLRNCRHTYVRTYVRRDEKWINLGFWRRSSSSNSIVVENIPRSLLFVFFIYFSLVFKMR